MAQLLLYTLDLNICVIAVIASMSRPIVKSQVSVNCTERSCVLQNVEQQRDKQQPSSFSRRHLLNTACATSRGWLCDASCFKMAAKRHRLYGNCMRTTNDQQRLNSCQLNLEPGADSTKCLALPARLIVVDGPLLSRRRPNNMNNLPDLLHTEPAPAY